MENDPAFAIIRIDADVENDDARLTVTRIAFAESVVARLNELNAAKGSLPLAVNSRSAANRRLTFPVRIG
jgi:hypothetical protein